MMKKKHTKQNMWIEFFSITDKCLKTANNTFSKLFLKIHVPTKHRKMYTPLRINN